MKLGQRGEADTAAVLDDRSASTVEVDVDIVALMHAELATPKDQDAVLDASDVCWTGNRAT